MKEGIPWAWNVSRGKQRWGHQAPPPQTTGFVSLIMQSTLDCPASVQRTVFWQEHSFPETASVYVLKWSIVRTLLFSYEYQTMNKSRNPVILTAVCYQYQNPLRLFTVIILILRISENTSECLIQFLLSRRDTDFHTDITYQSVTTFCMGYFCLYSEIVRKQR
jgi:hypothetical protein